MSLNLPLIPNAASNCRHCGPKLTLTLVNLGLSPVANDYVDPADCAKAEPFYPRDALVCRNCRLVQTCDMLAQATYFVPAMPTSPHIQVCGSTTPKPMLRTGPRASA